MWLQTLATSGGAGADCLLLSEDVSRITLRYFLIRSVDSDVPLDAALLWLRKLATSGEAGSDCLALWEVVECAVCDPGVGVSEGPPIICRSLCDRLLDACGGAYFALETMTQVSLGPERTNIPANRFHQGLFQHLPLLAASSPWCNFMSRSPWIQKPVKWSYLTCQEFFAWVRSSRFGS